MTVWTDGSPASFELKHKHIKTHTFHHPFIKRSSLRRTKIHHHLFPGVSFHRGCTDSDVCLRRSKHISQNYSILCNDGGLVFSGLYTPLQCSVFVSVCVREAETRKWKPLWTWPSGGKVLVCVTGDAKAGKRLFLHGILKWTAAKHIV